MMQVKNKQTGALEFMRHGPATDAVTAGTHEFVNSDEGQAAHADLHRLSKDELIEEAAKRNVDIKPGATKAEIIAALSGA